MKLLHGDCLELMKQIPDKSVDMILCDLPYGTTQNRWDSVLPLNDLWKQYQRILKPKGVAALFAQIPFSITLAASNLKWLKYEWIWEKDRASGHLNAKKQPMKAHENIMIFYEKIGTYNPQKTTGHKPSNVNGRRLKETTNYGKFKQIISGGQTDRYPRSVYKCNVVNGQHGMVHPTQKPVALLEYLIKTYTLEGETVLDNCMGSGSTGVACVNTGRDFIGIEKDAEYFEIAKRESKTHKTE
ncbi:MAG TPA: site-specific DNA-methyltransferase [Candidatus Omnitrophota bacterium]|nr:site-specific DNA-methyltransferase [Candidatus Omnitrophota bacterium]